MEQKSSDILPDVRDQQFKKWLQNKAVKDKAFGYLEKLESSRATSEESLIEVAVSLSAIEHLLGENDSANNLGKAVVPGDNDKKADDNAASAPTKTLKSCWTKWALEHHTFEMVRIPDKDVASLTGGALENLKSESDIAAASGGTTEGKSKQPNIAQSLKYFMIAPPKPNERAKPLSNDQRIMNNVCMRECRKLWKKASDEVEKRLTAYIEQREVESQSHVEAERKSKASQFNDEFAVMDARATKLRMLSSTFLNDIGLKRLSTWIEEDEDIKQKEEQARFSDKQKKAKSLHDQWVKKKDSLRIRMPDDLPPASEPVMTYGREVVGLRPAVKGTSGRSTVEIMAGSGLRYVHALNMGQRGIEGDLEKSRSQLLKLGFVHKSNFDESNIHTYDKERRENATLTERQELERKQKEDSNKAFEEWLLQKDMREQCIKCLSVIPKPTITLPISAGDPQMRKKQPPLSMVAASKEAGLCIQVGRAMKKIDRTLYQEWAAWCDGVFAANISSALWDYFPPMSCDVHSISYSQVRDAFLKILRPGLDYRETFVEFAEKRVLNKRISDFKDEKGYHRLEGAEKIEFEEQLELKRKEWLSEVSLNKANMSKLLISMGVAMKEKEMEALIEAFDSNGDGVVTLSEFLDFVGPKRDKRGGTLQALGQRCSWVTTCQVTGMVNSYTMSKPTKTFLRNQLTGQLMSVTENVEETSKQLNGQSITSIVNMPHTAGKIRLRQLPTGEQRLFFEVAERQRREDLLRVFGLIRSDGIFAGDDEATMKWASNELLKNEKPYERGGYEENDYENDFDTDHESMKRNKSGDVGEANANKDKDKDKDKDVAVTASEGNTDQSNADKGKNGKIAACDFSSWNNEKRKSGLRYLLDISKDFRHEELLKNMLANGAVPDAPRIWSDSVLDTDDDGDEALAIERLSTELKICWAPAKKGDLISFFSLEFAGPVGFVGITGEGKYREIYRDPPDADPDNTFSFTFTRKDLQPGIEYRFRIRAFNGYGPGTYSYKTFTTVTLAPLQPKVTKVCSESATLRWLFSKQFFRRFEELKRLFVLADTDHSGEVGREELAALMDDYAAGNKPLKEFLGKAAKGLGIDISQGFGALFDAIESDDDGGLSWEEFQSFFLAIGWGNSAGLTDHTKSLANAMVSQSLRSSVMSAGSADSLHSSSRPSMVKQNDLAYVVERCESEVGGVYKDVCRTMSGHASIRRLEAGKSYRFRVYSLNAEGVAGPRSPEVVVHTLLETPPPPTAPVKYISSRKLLLTWKPRNYNTGSKDKAVIEKMLGEWAGSHSENDGGVSIEKVFQKYDRDNSGTIDSAELAVVLTDLGIEVTEEHLSEAFKELDGNGDGVIAFEEFGKWWRREEVIYTIKRSEEVTGTLKHDDGSVSSYVSKKGVKGNMTSSRDVLKTIPEEASLHSDRLGSVSKSRPRSASSIRMSKSNAGQGTTAVVAKQKPRQVGVPIVSYRDIKTRCEVAGLTPNRLYHFRLRYVGSRSVSMLSPAAAIMTTPLPPSAPILIDVFSNLVRLKWYPPDFGTFKFILQLRLRDSPDDWGNVYNGFDNTWTGTTLVPDSSYESRCFCANFQGNLSESSEVVVFNTLPRKDGLGAAMNLNAKSISQKFNIECTADICVGDTILITERLFVRHGDSFLDKAADMQLSTTTPRDKTGASMKGSLSKSAGAKSRSVSQMRPKSAGASSASINIANANANSTRLSTASIASAQSAGVASITAGHGEYVGERTIAAYVCRDNYRTLRDKVPSMIAGGGSSQQMDPSVKKQRTLWLEVVWQKASNDACKPFELLIGEVLERQQLHLEQFEVYRSEWKHEKLRKQLLEEWATLQECFLPTDC